jgi:hypothetical protein
VDHSRLFTTEGWIPDKDFDDTWMPHFHSMVMETVQMDDVDAFKNVIVINFNYDRTLEHYLYSALQMKFGLDESGASQFLSNLKVVRPYGKVGSLPWQQDEPFVHFGKQVRDHNELFSLSDGIKTYAEGASGDSGIAQEMGRARMVVFLGFGFHRQNMKLLQARTVAEDWRRAFATATKMDTGNYDILKIEIATKIGIKTRHNLPIVRDDSARNLLCNLRTAISDVGAS